MTAWYLDTSAALKLLVEEPESDALAVAIDEAGPDLVACLLLETELRRVVHRTAALDHETVSRFLTGVTLHDLPPSLYREAGLLPTARLRSLDALHLAGAVRLDVEVVATYDVRMTQSVRELGLRVVAPA